MTTPSGQSRLAGEAARVVRRMAEHGLFLSADGGGHALKSEDPCGPSREVDPALARFLISTGLVERAAGGERNVYRVAESVGAYLRRKKAGAEGHRAQHKPAGGRAEDTPLEWLRKRKGPDGAPYLSEKEYRAGVRFRGDFFNAGLTPRLTVDLSRPLAGGGRSSDYDYGGASDAALDARDRFRSAARAVGPDLSDLLIDVCCQSCGLEAAERNRKWPKRAAKVVLKIALDRLARHYGLLKEEPEERSTGQPVERFWRAPGARPQLFDAPSEY